MIRKLRTLLGAGCLLLLISCGGSGTPTNTVMVYMLGSDLESSGGAATRNIEQMMQVSRTTGLNIVLETGGATSSNGPLGIDWTHVQRYLVSNGELTLLQDLGPDASVDLGQPQTLADFVTWADNEYPAARRILVLWDHGAGPFGGIGPDQITGTFLNLPALGAALQTAGVHFDLIGFDACLMASAEVGAVVGPHADYMVASEDTEPGQGWDYTSWLSYLQANPAASMIQVGRNIVDSYVAQETGDPMTLAVIDLAAMQSIVASMQDFAQALLPYANTSLLSWQVLADARQRTLDFNSPPFGLGKPLNADLADLLQLAGNMQTAVEKNFGADAALSQAVDVLNVAVQSAVEYKRGTLGDSSATGLSVYFPARLAAYPALGYPETVTIGGVDVFSSNYVETLLPAYYGFYTSHASSLQAVVSTQPVTGGVFNATVTNGLNFAMVGAGQSACTVYVEGVAQQQLCAEALQVSNEYTHEIGSSSWQFSFALPGTWPMLQGQAVVLLPDASALQGLSQLSYLVPVSLKDATTGTYGDGYLRVETSDIAGVDTYTVVGFQRSNKTPGRVFPLVPGEVYALFDYAQDGLGNWTFRRSSREITVSEINPTIDFGAYALSAGSPLIFVATDLTGGQTVGAVQTY